MSRRRIFNLAAACSLVLFLAMGCAWLHLWKTYIPEEDRLLQERRGINLAIQRARHDINLATQPAQALDAASAQATARYGAWEDAWRDYGARRPSVLAAERWRYVVLPRTVLLVLAALPMLWVLVTWRRLRRQPPPDALLLRLVRNLPYSAWTLLAGVCFILSLATIAIWIRSYQRTEQFSYGYYVNNGDQIISKQDRAIFGRGSMQLSYFDESGPWAEFHSNMDDVMRLTARSPHPILGLGHETLVPVNLTYAVSSERKLPGVRWAAFRMPVVGLGLITHGPLPPTPERGYLVIRLWMIEVLFLLTPIMWTWRWLNRRSHPEGYCTRCGYNLQGNMSGICPECGTNVAKPSASAVIPVSA